MSTSLAYANESLADLLADHPDIEVRINSADPGRTGANVIAGQTPAPVVWGAINTGTAEVANSQEASVALPDGAQARHFSLWDISSNSFIGGAPLTKLADYTSAGVYVFPVGSLKIRKL